VRSRRTVFALVIALVGLVALMPRPREATVTEPADDVIVAGAAGLRWDDVNATDTPTMWRLASRGSIGALSVRSARRVTCPGDGWLTLGAGNLARFTTGSVQQVCPPLSVEVDQTTDASPSATLPALRQVVDDNRTLPWGTEPGALAEAVRCTSAIGPGAAIAAARPYGRIDRYSDDPVFDDSCALSIVDLGEISGNAAQRKLAARKADATLASVLTGRPTGSLVVVAGLSDIDPTSRLHVAIAQGPGFTGGWLTSPSTVRPGYVQLVDLAPTILTALDRPVPTKLFAGGQITGKPGRPSDLDRAVGALADADREASVQHRVGGEFFLVLAFAQVAVFLLCVPLLRRARRPAGPVAPRPYPRRVVHAAEVLLVAAALAVPAALIADIVPWWRWGHPAIVFGFVELAVLSVVTTVVAGLTRTVFRSALAPLGGVAALGAVAVAFDVLTGSRLQLNGVAGYSSLSGSRYAGIGVIGLGVVVTGVLLGAATVARRVVRTWRPMVIALVGLVGVVLVGSPYLGADSSGAVALAAGVCTAVAMAAGGWLTLSRLVWTGAAALAVTAGFALVDLLHPIEQRSSVGRFLGHLQDGTATALLQRIGESDFAMVFSSPLTLLVIGCGLYAGFVLLRTWGGLKRVLGLFPTVRAAFSGIILATVFAGVIEGVGFNTLGAALATATPLAVLASLRALNHASDKTVPTETRPPTGSPAGSTAGVS
jgi:hypothetical protein